MLALDIIHPKDAVGLAHLTGCFYPACLYALAVFDKIFLPSLKSTSATQHGTKLAPVAVEQQRLESSNVVEPKSYAHNMTQLLLGQILVEHREVVAEIEVGLHRIALRQRSASYMIHNALRHTIYLPAKTAQTPT